MQIIKTELSAAAQAGALDASLAFNTIYEQHRELVTQSALSGLKGLQSLLTQSNIYASAINRMQEARSKVDEANAKALEKPFRNADSNLQNQHNTATANGLKGQAVPYQTTAFYVQNNAQSAINGTDATKTERTYANNVKSAADLLKSGMDAMVNNADVNTAVGRINQAYSDAYAAYQQASQLRTSLQGQNPAPTARINSLTAVMNAANDVMNTAISSRTLTNSPIAQIRYYQPTVYDLSDGYSLSTWGNSGYMTLVDANGQGVIISPDGTVDPLNGSGEGWKFNNTGTFVLPNETKITITPGSTANVLVTRGVHAFTIDNVRSGGYPSTSDFASLNGRVIDRSSNDGYIFNLNGTASGWTVNGQVLGDAGSREVVATSPIENELKLDPTDVTVTPGFKEFVTMIGAEGTDYDGDGLYNNEELVEISGYIFNYVQQLQETFAKALANVSSANEALTELNTFLELLKQQSDTLQGNRSSDNAENRATLQAIERKLIAALQRLRGGQETAPTTGNIENSAQNILSQINNFTQTGGTTPTPPPSNGSSSTIPQEGTTTGSETGNTGTETPTDPLGDGLRRASRLLSGLLGGGNLNILDMPPSTGNTQGTEQTTPTPSLDTLASLLLTAPNTEEPGLSMLGLEQLAQSLATMAGQLDPQASGGINSQNLAAGLQALFSLFDELGVVAPGTDLQANGPGVGDVLQTLNQLVRESASPTQTSSTQNAPSNSQLTAFLNQLSGLGALLSAANGSANAPSGTGNAGNGVAELQGANSRIAEQLALVLAGMAALGSAGAGQSTNTQGSQAPSSMELRLGLAAFLAAMSSFGIFGTGNQQQGGTSQNQNSGITFDSGNSAVRTIAGNFATDPELLKQLTANLNRAIQEHQKQLNLASNLFVQSQEIVQEFVNLIKEDDLVRDLVHTDDLSDEQQDSFNERMEKLKKDWGIEWGSSNQEQTPTGQSNLVSKAVQSGMMV